MQVDLGEGVVQVVAVHSGASQEREMGGYFACAKLAWPASSLARQD